MIILNHPLKNKKSYNKKCKKLRPEYVSFSVFIVDPVKFIDNKAALLCSHLSLHTHRQREQVTHNNGHPLVTYHHHHQHLWTQDSCI